MLDSYFSRWNICCGFLELEALPTRESRSKIPGNPSNGFSSTDFRGFLENHKNGDVPLWFWALHMYVFTGLELESNIIGALPRGAF